VSVLGSAEDLAVPGKQIFRKAGWAHIAGADTLGDGVPWIWNGREARSTGVRQTLDDDHHRSEHLYASAHRLYPNDPAEPMPG
jgi:hypothetical protein